MKRKILLGAAAALMCVAIVGVGYAAWVITNNADDTVNGQITVDEVVDKRLELTGSFAENAYIAEGDIISFGAPEGDTSGWLIAMEDEEGNRIVEDKTVTLGFTVGNYEMCKYVKVSVDLSDELEAAVDAGYITLEQDTFTYDAAAIEDALGVIEIDITFGWGSLFGNENPYVYFNASEVDGNDLIPDNYEGTAIDNGDYALELLEDLYVLNNAAFTITIEANVEAPSTGE